MDNTSIMIVAAASALIELALLYAIIKTYEYSKGIDQKVSKILQMLEEKA